MSPPIVLALFEGKFLSGPAKNLIQYVRTARTLPDSPRVEVALFERAGDSLPLKAAFEAAGITVHTIHESGAFDRRVLPAIGNLITGVRPRILQTHFVKSHFLVRLSGAYRKLPWIAFNHGYTADGWKTRIYNRLDQWSLWKAHRLVVVSRSTGKRMNAERMAPGRVRVVHNCVEPATGARGRGGSDGVILIAARLSREKNHLVLLEALRRLRDAHGLRPRLLVAGDGPERGNIERSIAALGLEQQVTLLGMVPAAAVPYRDADIFALPSESEGSPNALLEAMAAGTSIVATHVGGIPEIVADGESALLVPPGDAASLATALRRLLEQHALRDTLVRNARMKASQEFSPEARARAINAIYAELLHDVGAR